jgi:hypothetical protein
MGTMSVPALLTWYVINAGDYKIFFFSFVLTHFYYHLVHTTILDMSYLKDAMAVLAGKAPAARKSKGRSKSHKPATKKAVRIIAAAAKAIHNNPHHKKSMTHKCARGPSKQSNRILGDVVKAKLELEKAQAQLKAAQRRPFDVEAPAIDGMGSQVERVNAKFIIVDPPGSAGGTTGLLTTSVAVLIVFYPSAKGMVTVYSSVGSTTVSATSATYDAGNLPSIISIFGQARAAVGGLSVDIQVPIGGLPPQIFSGYLPVTSTFGSSTPTSILQIMNPRPCTSLHCNVNWCPADLANIETFSSAQLATGVQSPDTIPMILILNYNNLAATGNSMTINAILQMDCQAAVGGAVSNAPELFSSNNRGDDKPSYSAASLYSVLGDIVNWSSTDSGHSTLSSALSAATLMWGRNSQRYQRYHALKAVANPETVYRFITNFNQYVVLTEHEVLMHLQDLDFRRSIPLSYLTWFDEKYPTAPSEPPVFINEVDMKVPDRTKFSRSRLRATGELDSEEDDDPIPPSRAIEGDYVIYSDGSVRSHSGVKTKVSMSKSLMTTLSALP